MLRFGHAFRRPALSALFVLAAASVAHPATAQTSTRAKFVQPTVVATGGQVATFVTGDFDGNGLADFLYVNAPVVVGGVSQVTAGMLLRQPNGSYLNLPGNQVTFTNVSEVVAVVADFDGDGILDYAFATSTNASSPYPVVAVGTDLCVYYGTGSAASGNAYSTSKSGCMAFPLSYKSYNTTGNPPPSFGYMVLFPFTTRGGPNLMLDDSANGFAYVLANSGKANATPGVLSTFTLAGAPYPGGSGGIYPGDFNGDGKTDYITLGEVDAQTGVLISHYDLYLGDGGGSFNYGYGVGFGQVQYQPNSILLHDMTGNGILDMVKEGANGVLSVSIGNPSGCPTSSPCMAPTNYFPLGTLLNTTPADGPAGGGGHLIAIADFNGDGILDILTATQVGVSVLLGQGNGSYNLGGIYNAGPGLTCFAPNGVYTGGPGNSCYSVTDFNADGKLDLAIASPEGIAILYGNGDGTFQSNLAYSALAPALGATINRFRTAGNPNGNPDVMVDTGATVGQLLTGNGDGSFGTFPSLTNYPNTYPVTTPGGYWSNVISGDFNGDGVPDIAFSLTHFPLAAPGASGGSGLYVQYGNGDGTFTTPPAPATQLAAAPANNNFFGASVAADFNGDGITDIANVDQMYFDTLLGRSGGALQLGLNSPKPSSLAYPNPDSFPLVATGYFRNASKGVAAELRVGGAGPRLDFVFVDGTTITPYLNSGDGIHFTAMPVLSSPPNLTDTSLPEYYAGSVQFVDVDGDGNSDIVIPYQNLAVNATYPGASGNPATPNLLYIWYGNGDGTFAAPVVTTLGRNYYLSAVADMNGDGKPDILLSDGYLIDILYNLGSRSFGNEQHLLAGEGINSISVADVNNDGKPDLVVANGGLTLSNGVAIGGKVANRPSISLASNPDVNTGGITVLLNTSSANAGSLTATATTLALCVDGSIAFPCPANPATPPLIVTPIQMYYGQVLDGTASAAAADGSELSPTSTITFRQSATPICTVPAVPNTLCPAMAGMDIPVGTYTMTAVYNGDAGHAASTSNAIVVNVLADTTTATLTSSLNPSQFGQAVTFTATLNGKFASPTGTVTFYDSGTQIGTGTLSASGAITSATTLTTSTLAIGTHPITVAYAATQNFAAATSTALSQLVNPNPINLEDFSVTLASPSLTIETQHHTTTSVTLTSLLNFSGNIALSCANPPPYVTCKFSPNPATLTANGTTTVSLYIDTDYVLGYARNESPGDLRAAPLSIAVGLLLMPFSLFASIRARHARANSCFRLLVLSRAILSLAGLTSCGSSIRPASTPPGTYFLLITATGTPNGGTASITHSAPLTLTVTP
jgi:hypothetical protein